MPDKLPADFDAGWYAATYPDVALSGLGPREHYRRFGSLLGRKHKGSPPQAPQQAGQAAKPAEPAPEPVTKRAEPSPIARKATRSAPQPSPQPKRAKASPIIDRPQGFDAAAAVPQPAPTKAGRGAEGPFSLEKLATNAGGSEADRSAVMPALQAYAGLLNIPAPSGGDLREASVSCGARAFQAGATRIQNAWLVGPSRLRLMFSGGTETAASNGSALRAYQADSSSPADLRMLSQGVQLPPIGPVVYDLELLHSLMPLLLELSDADGVTCAFALLPFPSLLPGGLHSAELKALQTEPNPMDDFWALSDALLQEALGRQGWPDRSVRKVSIDRELATDDEPLSSPPVQAWLGAVFGLGNAPPRAADGGQELVLPPDCVPTISALVSRRLHGSHGAAVSGPYLVAEAGTYRPRWSIALPADQQPRSGITLCRGAEATTDASVPVDSAPIPLAIAIRSPPAAPSPEPADDARPASAGALSVLVYASDPERAERLIKFVRSAVAGEVEMFVRFDHAGGGLRAALDQACASAGWAEVPQSADLRAIARDARHDTMLTISDRVELDDGRALRAVLDLLQRDDAAGSASCALLAEKIIKKDVVLEPASGGLFPTGVSFVSGPRLSFGETDALQALPGLTYPVVANTLLLTAWRRRALVELPPVPGTGSAAAEDVRTGLDLMRAGYRNWCTTQVTARLSGRYVPRDAIDPVGAGYLQPERWEDILGRVTVVRELF